MTDHRAGYTRHNLPGLLDGDIEDVVGALADWEQSQLLEGSLA